MKALLQWSAIIPVLSWALFFSGLAKDSVLLQAIAGFLLIGSVLSAVHHSEVVAHKVGEPYGTIILAVAVTIIEVSIIISLMLEGGPDANTLARDTVFSATMIILNGIIGLSLFIGGLKFHEQNFSKDSARIALVSLISIIVITLVIPSYTSSVAGPYYSTAQLFFIAFACILIYSIFLYAQTKRHKEHFLQEKEEASQATETQVHNNLFITSLVFLLVSLGIVVLLAKTLSPAIEKVVADYNLPKALVGVIIAAIILLPEGIAAATAAKKNELQTSMNLALGSALASIGLTIPAVAVACSVFKMEIILGLDIKSIILLGLSVFIVMLSLSGGKTNIVYGAVLLINLFTFIYLIIYP